ncbi:hypothetical protein [Lysobacter fragariae]
MFLPFIALALAAEPQGQDESFKVFVDSIAHPPYVAACSSIFSKHPNLTELYETELRSWQERHRLEIEAGSKVAHDKGFTADSVAFEMAQSAVLRGTEALKRKSLSEQAERCDGLVRDLRK